MDPELIKFARAAESAAKAQDPTLKDATEIGREWLTWYITNSGSGYTPDQVERVFPLLATRSVAGGMATAALSGIAGGFDDELMAPTDQTNRDIARGSKELFRQEHPVLSIGSEVAGGILSPIARLLKLGKARTIGQAVVKGGAAGAAQGAVYGAGSAEGGVGERLKGAATGAVLGGAAGSAIGGVGGTLAQVFSSPQRRAMQELAHALETALPEGDMTEQGVAAVAKQMEKLRSLGLADDAILADLSPTLLGKLEYAATRSDRVFRQAKNVVKARQKGQSRAVLSSVREGVVGPINEANPAISSANPRTSKLGEFTTALRGEARAKQLKAGTKAWADAAYDELRAKNPTIPGLVRARVYDPRVGRVRVALTPEGERLMKLIDQPHVRKAMERAVQTGEVGAVPDFGQPSFQMLLDLKQAIGSAATKEVKNGSTNLGARLYQVRDGVHKFLVDHVPDYQNVNLEYLRRNATMRALDAGRQAWNEVQDAEGITLLMRELGKSPKSLIEFRRGMASEMVNELRAVLKNRNAVNRFFDMSDDIQEKLEAVFGTQAAFERFVQQVGGLEVFSRAAKALGGSDTARRQGMEGFLGALGTGFGSGVNWIKAAVARQLVKKTSIKFSQNTANALGPMLLTKGQANIEDAIRMALDGSPLVGSNTTQRLPAAAATGLLSIFDR